MNLTAHDLATNLEGFTVPATIVSRADAAKLGRELEMVENDLHAQAIRKQQMDLSIVSMRLNELAVTNNFDLAKQEDRKTLASRIKQLKDGSPMVHIVFAEEPRPEVLQKFTAWVRANLHPAALMHVGFQPGIVAGCVIRTPSHMYDFSIRAMLDRKKDVLVRELLNTVRSDAPITQPVPAPQLQGATQ